MNINDQLLKRVKSLAWRAGMMALAVVISVFAEGLAGLGLPPLATLLLGLVLGEVSKWLNSKTA